VRGGPPVGGTFQFQIFIQAPSLEIWRKTILVLRGIAGAVSGVACFLSTSLEKIIGGVTVIVRSRLKRDVCGGLRLF